MSPTQINDRLLSWAGDDLDPKAADQAAKTSRLPFVTGHVALMPDAHYGMGSTVGSVIPTRGAIIPAAIGVDIGCGMIAALLNIDAKDLPDDLGPLHSAITQAVPAGVGQGHDSDRYSVTSTLSEAQLAQKHWNDRLISKASKQFGSLGSGNHFVEICLDESDQVWVVLHSGSRGVGNEVAKVHIDGAKTLMKKYFIELEDKDLAYLVEGTPAFELYIADMLWAQQYAMGNRSTMLTAVYETLVEFVPQVQIEEIINCHHNFTQMEHHGGRDVWVTRKGAIKADVGDRGVIPGSMGTRSYIVSGLGSASSYCSCSHGAGRRMSRTEANKSLTYESLEKAMEGKTWNHSAALIDEHPDAYKDIDVVMERQRDLVSVDHTLTQILNYKGA